MINVKNSIRFSWIFWVFYFAFEFVSHAAMSDNYYAACVQAILNVSTALMVSYISTHFLFKHYYLTNKKSVFGIGLIATAVFFIFLKRCINFYLIFPYTEPKHASGPLIYLPKLLFEFFYLYFIVLLYSMFYFMRGWYSQQQALNELKQEKTAAELELLKSQVQPHFIFNTLNSIYAEAFQKSPETARQIIKLSQLLEYALYDSKKEKVLLEDELAYIENYFDLQKIRIGDKVDLSINVFNTITGIYILPLLMMPLIENCFKHGVNKAINSSWVRLDIAIKNGELVIKAENSIEEEAQNNTNQNSGLGLNNVKRRLELLYPNAHEFRIYKEENSFLVVLKLTI